MTSMSAYGCPNLGEMPSVGEKGLERGELRVCAVLFMWKRVTLFRPCTESRVRLGSLVQKPSVQACVCVCVCSYVSSPVCVCFCLNQARVLWCQQGKSQCLHGQDYMKRPWNIKPLSACFHLDGPC